MLRFFVCVLYLVPTITDKLLLLYKRTYCMIQPMISTCLSLLTSPLSFWTALSRKRMRQSKDFLNRFVYPMMCLVVLSAFVGQCLYVEDLTAESVIKRILTTSLSLYVGFHMSCFLLNKLLSSHYFKRRDNLPKVHYFIGNLNCFIYTMMIVLNLLPGFFFLGIAYVCVAYMVWQSLGVYFRIDKDSLIFFILSALAILAGVPYALHILLSIMIPN